jgi:hypothetical protein
MAKKKKPDDPEQYRRFVEVAKEHLGENAEEKLEEALKKILKRQEAEPGQEPNKQEVPP